MKRKSLILIIALIIFTPQFLKAQVSAPDSLALIDIYDNLDGDNWSFWTGFYSWYRNHWVYGWGGIEVNNYHVDSVDLGWAYLKETIPSSIGNLTTLRYLSSKSLRDSIYENIYNINGSNTQLYT